jgi:putative sugar O-methyltransferase
MSPIADDRELLRLMVSDNAVVEGIYQPGPYWKRRTKAAVRQIDRFGLGDFRGASNAVGLSFTDSVLIDRSMAHASFRGRAAAWAFTHTPISRSYGSQTALTRDYWEEFRRYRNANWQRSSRVRDLLDRYRILDSVGFGCLDTIEIDGNEIAAHYLQTLDTHDRLTAHVDYNAKETILEIGGGFGAYVHLLATNYPNMRKFLYLDISPNLYVGTQYLRSLFGKSVRTYRDTRGQTDLRFQGDHELEILCIAPHQLQFFGGKVDLVHNAHSFVEMPREVVAN